MLGGYNYQYFQIWPTGNFQAVDRTKIKAWNGFYPVFTKGKVLPSRRDCTPGQGNAPYRVLYLDPDRSTGLPLTKEGPRNNKAIVQWWNDATNKAIGGKPQPTSIVGPPAHFNMDSMGYNGDVIKKQPSAGLVGRAPQRPAQGPRRRPERPRHRDGRTSATPSRRSG